MPLTVKTAVLHEGNQSKNACKVLIFLYNVEKMTYSISTTFIGMTYATSIPTTVLGMLVEPLQALLMPLAFPQTTVVGTDIPTKLVGTVYFDKPCS